MMTPMLAVALALLSSVSWGAADFLGGLWSRRIPLLAVMVVSQAAGLAVIAAMTVLAGAALPGGRFALYAALSGAAGIAGIAAFYRGLAVGVMSIVAPISAASAIIPLTVGLAAGDRLTATQGAGVALALGGVVLASIALGHGAGGRRGGRIAAGAGLALLSAAGFGWFYVFIDAATSGGVVLGAVLLNRAVSVALLLGAATATGRLPRLSRRDAPGVAAVGILDISANVLFAVASTKGMVSVVAVIGSLYPVTTLALAHLVLGERIRPLQRAGVAAALAGVALMGAG